MKTSLIQYIITSIGLILSITSFFVIDNYFTSVNLKSTEKVITVEKKEVANQIMPTIENEPVTDETTEDLITIDTDTTSITTKPVIKEETITTKKIVEEEKVDVDKIIFDGLTLTELTNKLNKNLYSTLTDKGIYFAKFAQNTGLDPYLSLAIVLHETGCKWGCSSLVRDCNNVGGIKGSPSCNGGSYKRYDSLEEGINSYLEMVNNNYYSKGLTTPELMNPKYAASTDWARAVNNYIDTIRSS